MSDPMQPLHWRQARLSVAAVYAAQPGVVDIGGVTVGSLGNFSASIGKAKSKKSFNVSAIAAAALGGGQVLQYSVAMPTDKPVILYVDTEQSLADCQRVMHRIHHLAGLPTDTDHPRLVFLALRQYSPEERVTLIEQALAEIPGIGLAIIDGVRDLLHDINNPVEATNIVSKLMRWTDLYQIHIHTVLHQNKSDEHARGHVGTELDNKAETVLLVERDRQDGNVSVVKPMFTRSGDFTPFAFRIAEGQPALPQLVADYGPQSDRAKGKFDPYLSVSREQHEAALDIIFADADRQYSYTELLAAVKEAYSQVYEQLGNNRAVAIVTFLTNQRLVIHESDRKGAPYRRNPLGQIDA